MASQKKFLEESRDCWQEQVSHDRKQFLASFVIAATGLTGTGIGIGTMLNGSVTEGLLEIGVGSGLAIAFGKLGLSEVQDFADMTAQTAIRQSWIDELPKPPE